MRADVTLPHSFCFPIERRVVLIIVLTIAAAMCDASYFATKPMRNLRIVAFVPCGFHTIDRIAADIADRKIAMAVLTRPRRFTVVKLFAGAGGKTAHDIVQIKPRLAIT